MRLKSITISHNYLVILSVGHRIHIEGIVYRVLTITEVGGARDLELELEFVEDLFKGGTGTNARNDRVQDSRGD